MPTKVLLLEHNVDGTVGGSHYCLLEICRHLDRSRYVPLVWMFQDNAIVERYRETGADVVIECPPGPLVVRAGSNNVATRLRSIWQSTVNVARVIVTRRKWWEARLRRLGVGLVHLNNSALADIDLQLACWRLGIPCIAHQRGFPPEPDWITLRIARSLRAIIAISTSIQEHLLRVGLSASRIKLIFDGIDPSRIDAVLAASDLELQSLGVPAGVPLVGIVGNVKRWKGQDVVVKAMMLLRRKHPTLKCLIVGSVVDQRFRDELVTLCAAEGLGEVVKIIGYHPSPPSLMARMDVVLHASTQAEPFGIVLLEAMALGRPVVAARAGGPIDIIVDGVTGILFTPGDAQALAECTSWLLCDEDAGRRIALAGRERMRQMFTAKANVDRLQRQYDELLNWRSSAKRQ